MNKLGLILAIVAASWCGMASPGSTQDFSPWTSKDDASEAVAQTEAATEESGDFGWMFRVIKTSSVGVSLDSLTFEVSITLYADALDPGYKRMDGRSFNNRIVLTTSDGATFRAATATYRMTETNSAAIDLSFTPMSDDDGVLDPDEPNCRVVNALRKAASFTVTFPNEDGAMESYTFTGQGSGRALGTLGVC